MLVSAANGFVAISCSVCRVVVAELKLEMCRVRGPWFFDKGLSKVLVQAFMCGAFRLRLG